MAFGTLSVSDLLASTQPTLAQIPGGEAAVFGAFQQYLDAHNVLLQEKLANFVDVTTDDQRAYGGTDSMTMEDLDEYGRAEAQKAATGASVGFPLRRIGIALQWTRQFLLYARPNELAAQLTARADADILAVDRAIRRALFVPTNYTFTDRLVRDVALYVKALTNADSAFVGVGPNGESFDASTHTHYLATSSLVAANISALIQTVIEHYVSGAALLYINKAQEAAVRAMTSNFTPYYDSRQVIGSGITTAQGTLDPIKTYNRAIGLFDGAEVWVKPWIPAGYMFAWLRGAPVPLVMREPSAGPRGLQLEYDNEQHPLRAQGIARQFGIAAWNRTNGACLYIGGSSYTAPTIS